MAQPAWLKEVVVDMVHESNENFDGHLGTMKILKAIDEERGTSLAEFDFIVQSVNAYKILPKKSIPKKNSYNSDKVNKMKKTLGLVKKKL